MKYGMPYKGSKNKLAGKIFELFPHKKNFYDLFCGGCAMTHYGLLHGDFENYYMNDINPACPELFMDAVHGKFKDEKRWISREDFFRLKDSEPYVAFCWSFGNTLREYMYGKEIDPYKKALHYAIFFDDHSFIQNFFTNDFSFFKKEKNALVWHKVADGDLPPCERGNCTINVLTDRGEIAYYNYDFDCWITEPSSAEIDPPVAWCEIPKYEGKK